MATELVKVTVESENKLGSLPVYVSSGEHKAGVIVLQEYSAISSLFFSI